MPRLDHQKCWIDLEGAVCPVSDAQSHEEYANQQGYELETLLDDGWVRVQITSAYVLIDFRVRLNARQAAAVGVLCKERFEQVVVEFGGEARSFADADDAMKYVLVAE